MAYIGITKDGEKIMLGDVPPALLNDVEFCAQFSRIVPDTVEANRLAGAHIDRYFPTYKQLNILRVGTAEEIAQMGTFIDVCRAWSNGETPDPAALEAIQP